MIATTEPDVDHDYVPGPDSETGEHEDPQPDGVND